MNIQTDILNLEVHNKVGKTMKNGFIELFKGKLRDKLLNREIFDTILNTKVLTEK